MSLTPSDITWYHATCNFRNIIVSCGEYSNVPLLGMQGGISYNPILAKRQFGCPMETKPNNIYLEGEFYFNHEDPSNIRGKFVQAWRAIRRLSRSQLGKKLDFSHGLTLNGSLIELPIWFYPITCQETYLQLPQHHPYPWPLRQWRSARRNWPSQTM